MSAMNESLLGKEVKIKRSSGQRQNGLVSRIDNTNKCVLVEWEENGQAKAKEVFICKHLSVKF